MEMAVRVGCSALTGDEDVPSVSEAMDSLLSLIAQKLSLIELNDFPMRLPVMNSGLEFLPFQLLVEVVQHHTC